MSTQFEGRPAEYDCAIDQGYTRLNDAIVAHMAARVRGETPLLDIGCNVGFLLRAVGHGVGVDCSLRMVRQARARGLRVLQADAAALPFPDQTFRVAVLSCVLEQVPDVAVVVGEARRVATRVVGMVSRPGSRWGRRWGWVRSITPPEWFVAQGARVAPWDADRYCFDWEEAAR